MLVAFVCTGNICRSPMAEAFAGARHRVSGVTFVSAGTSASPGTPASSHAVRVMADIGIDVTNHSSRDLDSVMTEEPDIVYTMTGTQVTHVRNVYPDLADRVILLNGDGGDIPDPYGQNVETYRRARDLIASAISRRALDWIS